MARTQYIKRAKERWKNASILVSLAGIRAHVFVYFSNLWSWNNGVDDFPLCWFAPAKRVFGTCTHCYLRCSFSFSMHAPKQTRARAAYVKLWIAPLKIAYRYHRIELNRKQHSYTSLAMSKFYECIAWAHCGRWCCSRFPQFSSLNFSRIALFGKVEPFHGHL